MLHGLGYSFKDNTWPSQCEWYDHCSDILHAIIEAPVNIRHGRKCVCVGVFVVL